MKRRIYPWCAMWPFFVVVKTSKNNVTYLFTAKRPNKTRTFGHRTDLHMLTEKNSSSDFSLKGSKVGQNLPTPYSCTQFIRIWRIDRTTTSTSVISIQVHTCHPCSHSPHIVSGTSRSFSFTTLRVFSLVVFFFYGNAQLAQFLRRCQIFFSFSFPYRPGS
jgi:hypothetical protein